MKRLLLFVISIHHILFVIGQVHNLRFEHYTLKDGLPGNVVHDIEQDSTGILWFATDDGLAGYNGHDFVSYYYEPGLANSLLSNIINVLYVDSKGRLWIGTNNGLCLYIPEYENFMHYRPVDDLVRDLLSNTVRGIDEDSNGRIYFLTEDGKLHKIEDGKIITILNLKRDGCKFMTIDHFTCWIASKNILFQYLLDDNLTKAHQLAFRNTDKTPEIKDIIIKNDELYIAELNSELFRYNMNTVETEYFSYQVENPITSSLLREGPDNMWIGTSDGLRLFNTATKTMKTYKEDPRNSKSLSANGIYSIFKDRQGNLWVGTEQGINVSYPSKGFNGYSYKTGNHERFSGVSSFLEDRNGRLWIGYDKGGIHIYQPDGELIKKILNFPGARPNSLLSKIFCMHEDSAGNIWIGTYLHGLFKYIPGEQKAIQYFPGISGYSIQGEDVRSIIEDDKGNLWIAIHGHGINIINHVNKKIYKLQEYNPMIPDVVNQKWPFQIAFDHNQNLWVASSRGGVFYDFETNEYSHFTSLQNIDSSLSDNNISSLMIDRENNVWLGSWYGLNILPKGKLPVIKLTTNHGLPHNHIAALNEDLNGHTWAATNHGLARISHDSLQSFEILTYDMNDGLHDNGFNPRSTLRTQNGRIYFGGNTGYTAFFPDSINMDTIPPDIIFTNLYILNKKAGIHNDNTIEGFTLKKSVQFVRDITLKSKYNVIEFEFAALNFINPQDNTYQYKLEGFDNEWKMNNHQNRVTYTNLEPGNYVFKVKAANGDGYWNNRGISLPLTVLPPFYKSKPALMMYILLVIVSFFILRYLSLQRQKTKLEIEHQERIQNLRTRFFVNVSHELKTPLTLISVPLKKILQQTNGKAIEISRHELIQIYRNVDRLLKMVLQILDFRKIELNKSEIKVTKSNIIPFIQDVVKYFEYEAHQKNIHIVTNFFDEEVNIFFDPDKMEKVLYNILSNAIKFSYESSQIEIVVKKNMIPGKKKGEKEGEYLEIKTIDSGEGIPAHKLPYIFDRFSEISDVSEEMYGGTGIGLSIVKEFVEMHHGVVNIDSIHKNADARSSGTTVMVYLPLTPLYYNEEQIVKNEKHIQEIRNDKALLMYKPMSEEEERNNNTGRDAEKVDACKLLIIDDDPEIRWLLRKELAERYTVLEATNSASGLGIAEKHLPELIISDVMMKGIDGYALCNFLKNKLETSHIPVILLTAKGEEEDEIIGLKSGADAFIAKPFSIEKLMSLIESLINNRNILKQRFLTTLGIEIKQKVPTSLDEKFMEDMLKIINNHLSDTALGIETFTKEMGISRSQIYKKLNAIADTSLHLLIRKVRMNKAAEYLVEGKFNVAETAYKVGFNNLPYFSKCFLEEFGVPPSMYGRKK